MAREPKDPWEVVTAYTRENGEAGYARLEHRGRMTWCERVAKRHAREYKANHLRDAWAQRDE